MVAWVMETCDGAEGREGEMTKGHEDTFGGVVDMYIILIVVKVSWLNTCQNSSNCKFIYVHCMWTTL